MKRISLFLFSLICASTSLAGSWNYDLYHSVKDFNTWETQQGLIVDTDGTYHVAYGGDRLYVASNSGTGWQVETVDNEISSGDAPCILASDNGDLHVLYSAVSEFRHAVRTYGSTDWTIRAISQVTGRSFSTRIDSNNAIHLSMTQTNSMPVYMTNESGTWVTETIPGDEFCYSGSFLDLDSNEEPVIAFTSRGIAFYPPYGHAPVIWGNAHSFVATRSAGGWTVEPVYEIGEGTLLGMALDSQDNIQFLVAGDIIDYPYTELLSFRWNGWGYDYTLIDPLILTWIPPSIDYDSNDIAHLSFRTYPDNLIHATENGMSWDIEILDAGVRHSSITMADNNSPAIAGFFPDTLELKSYIQQGTSWQTDTIDQAGVNPDNFHGHELVDMAVDSSGTPHLAICRNSNLYHAWLTGNQWFTEPIEDSSEYWYGMDCDLDIDPDDNLHVCYHSNNIPDGIIYSVNSGSGWETQQMFQTEPRTVKAMDIGPDGNPMFVAVHTHASTLYFSRKINDDWVQFIVDEAGFYTQDMDIAVDSTGQAHLSYYNEENGELRYAVGLDDTWSIETIDGQTTNRGYSNHIIVDNAGTPYISYRGNGLSVAWKDGTDWVIQSITPMTSSDTAIVLDSLGYPHVAGDNKYAWFDGSQWHVDIFDDMGCQFTTMDLTPSDSPLVFYKDKDLDYRFAYKEATSPVIDSIDTPVLYQELSYPGVTLNGSGFTDVIALNCGIGIIIDDWEVVSDSQITMDLALSEFTRTGLRNVSVSTATGVAVCDECITVEQGPPHIDCVYPAFCPNDFSYPVNISGTHFLDTQSVIFTDGIIVNSFDVLSAQDILVDLTIPASVPDGFHDVTVVNPAGSDTITQCFETGSMLVMWEYEATVPERVQMNTPFMITIHAIDYSGQHALNWNGSVNIQDTATYTLDPNIATIVNGTAVVEATVSGSAFNNQIYISGEGRSGYSNTFDIIAGPADCEFEEVQFDTQFQRFGEGTWPSKYSDIASDGTIWIAFGVDNLWVYHGDGENWVRERVDSAPGTGACTSLSLDPAGYPHISYNDTVEKSTKYAHLTSHGWITEVVDENGWAKGKTAIDVDSTGTPHIVHSTAEGMAYSWRQADGTWVKQMLTNEGANECDIAVDGLNRPHITTYRRYGPRLYFGYLNDVWTQTQPTGATGEYGGITVDSQNRPHLCCYEYSSGYSDIRYTYWDGTAWQGTVVPNTADCIFSEIALDASDRPGIITKNNDDIRYLYHDGANWQYSDMSGNLGIWNLTLARDDQGWPHCVVRNGSQHQLEYCTWDGSQWTHSHIMRDALIGRNNVILCDSNHNLSIVSVDEERPFNNNAETVHRLNFYQQSTSTWQQETLLEIQGTAALGGTIAFDAAMDENDDPVFAVKTQTGTDEYYFCYFDGPDFVMEPVFSYDPVNANEVTLALAPDQTPWIAFLHVAESMKQLRVAHPSGTSWEIDTLCEANYISENSLTAGPDNLPGIVYVSDEPGYRQCYLATYTGSSWSIDVPHPHPCSFPKLVFDNANTPHIVLANGDVNGLLYVTHDGQSWISETITETPDCVHYLKNLVADSQGNLHIVYGLSEAGEYHDHSLMYGTRVGGQWYTYLVKENAKTILNTNIVLDSDDVPHFSYQNEWSGDLMYSTCGIFTPPLIDSVVPGSAYPGESIQNIEITGTGLFPVTAINLGEGVRLDDYTIVSNARILVDVTVDAAATPGIRDVRVNTSAGAGVCNGCFVVADPSLPDPVLTDIAPERGNIWESYQVTLFGENLDTATIVDFGPSILVDNVQVLDAHTVRADIQIEPWADLGFRTVSVVTGAGDASCHHCFEVEYFEPETPTPTATSSTPTHTPTYTPTYTPTSDPTETPTVTPSGAPTHTPSSTPTPTPDVTTTPTISPTATAQPPTATPDPNDCDFLGTRLEISQDEPFEAGDSFWLKLHVCNNTENTLTETPTCVLLGVYGQFWYWPGWSMTFDWQTETYILGQTTINIFEPFIWPEVSGHAYDLAFYSGILNETMSELVGEVGVVSFGYQ